ncbi:MAG: hypothetical protein ACREBE_16335 [bacterium]
MLGRCTDVAPDLRDADARNAEELETLPLLYISLWAIKEAWRLIGIAKATSSAAISSPNEWHDQRRCLPNCFRINC